MNQFLPEGRRFPTPENQSLLRTPEGLHRAMEEGCVLEAAPCRCDAAHTLHFRLGKLHAIMPREECALGVAEGRVREIAILSRVGRPTAFLVEGLTAHDGVLVPRLSRRAAQQRALDYLQQLPQGSVLPATVTRLERFGAFIDVGCGLPSLIPLSAISVSRLDHPSSRFQTGQEIYVLLRDVRPEEGRIFVSHRELLGTWSQNAARFSQGEVVTGTVRGVMDYGIFVELAPNLPALAEYLPDIQNGERVSVFIKAIVPEKEKMKLIILGRAEGKEERQPLEYYIKEGVVRNWHFHRQPEDPIKE